MAGGFRGNIAAYADWVNTRFYNLLLQKNAAGELTGKSTGIVMMDRVGEYEASKRIPQIIVANNFQFALKTTLDLTKGGNVKQEDVILSREQNRSTKSAAPIITWE